VKGDLPGKVREEFKKAKTAGLEEILASKTWESQHTSSSSIKPATSFKPEKKPVTKTISGIDIMELDNAVVTLGEIGIYSESGMGCTGPVILVAEEDYRKAAETLCASNYISALPLDC